ncbi:hypothetical protein [Aeromicrobium sp. NPDC092404]|uniref:hypothetical protein n=1 Tax=Aeromicrobium sp. NPDC092404 TaxID=3154976 RepID=UPI00341A089B
MPGNGKFVEQETPAGDKALSKRMTASAGGKLEKRLQQMGWSGEPPSSGADEPDDV